MRCIITMFMTAVVMVASGAFAGEGDAVLGKWLTAEGRSQVEITLVDGKYCGTISWLKEPVYPEGDDEAGKTKHDRKNPDPAKQALPLIGLNLIEGFTFAGDNTWTGGTIYDPENGKTYQCKMTLDGDTLNVRGFIGISLIGRTTAWTRLKTETAA